MLSLPTTLGLNFLLEYQSLSAFRSSIVSEFSNFLLENTLSTIQAVDRFFEMAR